MLDFISVASLSVLAIFYVRYWRARLKVTSVIHLNPETDDDIADDVRLTLWNIFCQYFNPVVNIAGLAFYIIDPLEVKGTLIFQALPIAFSISAILASVGLWIDTKPYSRIKEGL